MARTKPYSTSSHSRTNTHTHAHKMSHRHRSYGSSSHAHSPSSPGSSSESRSRRGRQARPSQLTGAMHSAVRGFSRAVGAPNVVEPAGFRDFRGWLARLQTREMRVVWDLLIANVAREVKCDAEALHSLKEDIVREIVKCVVVPREDESAKLVSTNAGRQASKPRSGTTLMIVLEHQLARVDCRLAELVEEYPAMQQEGDRRGGRAGRLPGVEDILRGEGLPSFRELDASIRKHGSGSGSR